MRPAKKQPCAWRRPQWRRRPPPPTTCLASSCLQTRNQPSNDSPSCQLGPAQHRARKEQNRLSMGGDRPTGSQERRDGAYVMASTATGARALAGCLGPGSAQSSRWSRDWACLVSLKGICVCVCVAVIGMPNLLLGCECGLSCRKGWHSACSREQGQCFAALLTWAAGCCRLHRQHTLPASAAAGRPCLCPVSSSRA